MSQPTLAKEIAFSVRDAVSEAIARGHWQHYEGPYSLSLEKQLAGRVGQSQVQLASSGTAAVEVCLRAAGIGSGDEVMLSSYDYPGNFWAIERVGARPVLLETRPNSWSIDRESIELGFKPTCKALIASHLHGELEDAVELRAWCDERKIILIEDACQALGARWHGSPVGSFGHFSILSFGGGKVLSSGRGGAWATSDETLAIKARVAAGAGSGPYALSELQAATLLAQLPWLDKINASCRVYFEELDQHLRAGHVDWLFVPSSEIASTAFYQCGWQLGLDVGDDYRQRLLTVLRQSESQVEKESEVNELPFGIGFPGFHRRSERRCRSSGLLNHAAAAASRTIVLHHRVVLQQRWSAKKLADWIVACTAGMQ